MRLQTEAQEFSFFETFYNKDPGPNFPPSLHCRDFSWMSGENKLERFRKIYSWGSEININNLETEANENNTQGGALDIKLSPAFGGYYTFQELIHIRNFSFNDTSLFISGPLTLTINSPKTNEMCQVEFSPDFLKAIKISDRETKKRDQLNFRESPTPLSSAIIQAAKSVFQYLPTGDLK